MRSLILVMLLWPVLAAAQFTCVPQTASTPSGTGSRVVESSPQTPDIGDWRYVWCPAGGYYVDGKPKAWHLERHVVLAKYRGASSSLVLAIWQAFKSTDVLAALNMVVKSGEIKPTTPQEVYEYSLLRWQACIDASAKPYLVDVSPLPADFCGPAPIPPGSAADVWRTPASGSSLYTATAGKLTAKIVGRTAPAGALCDCTNSVTVGSSTYCPLATALSSEVALCKKVTP